MSVPQVLEVHVAKHDFTATREDEVSLQAGLVVEDVEELPGDWWRGRVAGVTGTFPACFVEVVRSTGMCTVLFPFSPRHSDEVELVLGQEVAMFGEVEAGTWGRGRVGARLGCFPLTYVRQYPVASPRASSPVTLRRQGSGGSAVRQSCSGPVSANLFDPEDEPLGPLFGSISSKIGDASVDSFDFKTKEGFLSRIRHSFGGKRERKSLEGRVRLSSGSYLETQSVCSSSVSRKSGSFSAFMKRCSLSSRSGSKYSLQPEEEVVPRPNRLSRSWDMTAKIKKEAKSPDVVKMETDFRHLALSPETPQGGPRSGLSWVWQEVKDGREGLLPPPRKRQLPTRSDSGLGGSEAARLGPEEMFGPVEELTDEVFTHMFSPSGGVPEEDDCRGAGPVLARPCSIRTQVQGRAGPVLLQGSGARNCTVTNPRKMGRPRQEGVGAKVTEL